MKNISKQIIITTFRQVPNADIRTIWREPVLKEVLINYLGKGTNFLPIIPVWERKIDEPLSFNEKGDIKQIEDDKKFVPNFVNTIYSSDTQALRQMANIRSFSQSDYFWQTGRNYLLVKNPFVPQKTLYYTWLIRGL